MSRTARYSFMAPEEAPATRRYRRYRVFPHDSCRYPSYRGACAAKLQALGWTLGEARQRAAQVVPDPPTGDQGDDDGDPDGIVTLDKLGAVEVDTIARGLFFRDKLGVLHGKGGSGKTTVVAGALAAITTGADWLGAPTTVEGDVLIVGAEDVDIFRARIAEWGGDLARVHVWERSNLDRLPAVLAKVAPVAVVFDSLQTVAHAAGVNSNSSDEAANIMRPMVAARKGSGAGWLVLHHEPWEESRPRNSTEIVCAVDYTLGCACVESAFQTTLAPSLKWRHGIPKERLRLALGSDGFVLWSGPEIDPTGGGGGGEPGLFDRQIDRREEVRELVREYLQDHPKASCNAIRQALQKRAVDVRAAVKSIRSEGASRCVPDASRTHPGEPSRGCVPVRPVPKRDAPRDAPRKGPDDAPNRDRGPTRPRPVAAHERRHRPARPRAVRRMAGHGEPCGVATRGRVARAVHGARCPSPRRAGGGGGCRQRRQAIGVTLRICEACSRMLPNVEWKHGATDVPPCGVCGSWRAAVRVATFKVSKPERKSVATILQWVSQPERNDTTRAVAKGTL